MELGQLLAGKRGTKVGIVIADDAQSKLSKARQKLAITTQSPATVRHSQRPGLAITDADSADPLCQVVVMQARL